MRSILLLLLAGLLSTGCTAPWLARKLVAAPNRSGASIENLVDIGREFTPRRFDLPATEGRPAVSLAAAIVEPGDWKLVYAFDAARTAKALNLSLEVSFRRPEAAPLRPRGTVFLLHGFAQQKEQLAPWAVTLAQAGYRCVLVDLRGHGESTGGWIGYGAFEAMDLKLLLDRMAEAGLVEGKVGVLGVSLGASAALLWAGQDGRVATVVALEPFADPRAAIASLLRNFPPFRRKLWWAPDATIRAAIREAPVAAGFRWGQIDIPGAVPGSGRPVLFLHGAKDTLVPPADSEALRAVAAPGSRLVLLPEADHITLPFLLKPLEAEVLGWFAGQLGGGPAGPPADPARSPQGTRISRPGK